MLSLLSPLDWLHDTLCLAWLGLSGIGMFVEAYTIIIVITTGQCNCKTVWHASLSDFAVNQVYKKTKVICLGEC